MSKEERFVRFITIRSDKKEHVITVALVSERVDRYRTIIEPDGCITDFKNVIVDYNHNGSHTGADLKNRRIEMVELDNGDRVKALVGDVHIYEDSMLRDKDGKDLFNAYESVENKRIKTVSVEFEPIDEETFTNEQGITRFRKWELRRLALLDRTPGQGDAMILNTRDLKNTKSITPEDIEPSEKLQTLKENNVEETSRIDNKTMEKDNVETTPKDSRLEKLESDMEEMRKMIKGMYDAKKDREEIGDEVAEEEKASREEATNIEELFTKIYEALELTDMEKEMLEKLVMEKTEEKDEEEPEEEMERSDDKAEEVKEEKTEEVVEEPKVEETKEDSKEEVKEETKEEVVEEKEDDTKRILAEKEKELKSLKEKFQRLANSPEEKASETEESVTDKVGDEAAEDETPDPKEQEAKDEGIRMKRYAFERGI